MKNEEQICEKNYDMNNSLIGLSSTHKFAVDWRLSQAGVLLVWYIAHK